LELFLELNCYFTLGPDGNPDIIANVPLERLFLETDGIGAIDWAGGEMTERETNPEFQKIPSVLEENLSRTAQVKGIPAEIVREKMFHNLCEFLNETSGCF
jgi:Tat protein secretion system quality control protein TatD with DNase activity